MPESRAADPQTRTIARALLALELGMLAIGVVQYAFAPTAIEHPLVAALTLSLLASGTLILWLWTSQRLSALKGALHAAMMIGAISALAWASGAAHSAFASLYVLPLAGAALALGRWWWVLLSSSVIVGCAYLLGAITPDVDIQSVEFALRWFALLAPGLVVALLLSVEITRGQQAARRIRDLASTDALTGVLNLRAFESAVQQAHAYAERRGANYSILMVDVDNLSQINESSGHEAGSLVLSAVAGAIVRSVRSSDVVARFGGDEFVVLCTQSSPDIAASIAQRIRNNVYASTVSAAHRLIRANVSVGAANFPEDRMHPKDLMILASHRMQQDHEQRAEPSKA